MFALNSGETNARLLSMVQGVFADRQGVRNRTRSLAVVSLMQMVMYCRRLHPSELPVFTRAET